MTSTTRRSLLALALTATVASTVVAGSGPAAASAGDRGKQAFSAVFVGTNHNNTYDASEPAHEVAYYTRAASGALSGLPQLVGTRELDPQRFCRSAGYGSPRSSNRVGTRLGVSRST